MNMEKKIRHFCHNRINKAPTKGFTDDVGSKETHRFMYPESFLNPSPDVNFVLMDFKLLDIAWLTSALTNGSITRYQVDFGCCCLLITLAQTLLNPSMTEGFKT